MTKRILFGICLVAFLSNAPLALARVAGLPDFTGLVEKASPAVVNIQVTQFGQRARDDQDANLPPQFRGQDVPEIFRRFFDTPGNPGGNQPDRRGAGSGFIIEEDGYIITNNHVVEDADQIIVRLADRREYEATLVGTDQPSDIALLKIEARNLPTLKLGDSTVLKAGEWVVAIGSPFNFEQTVTAGIVSAKGRSTGAQQYVPFIQTDVAINRGNSGGPLLNMDGEVVGINSWILSSSGGYIGLSFSIPIETAASTVRQLREHGKVSRGLLGVVVGQVTRELAEAMNLGRSAGALVNDISPGGSADRAGIKPGDIILEFNGQPIETSGDLPPLVGSNPPGSEATVLVSRNGKERTFEVTLDALDEGQTSAQAADTGAARQSNALGLAVEALTPDMRRVLGNPEGGVLISEVESDAAYRAGLRSGDVILMINNTAVEDVDGFEKLVSKLPKGKAVALRILRDGSTNFFAYTPSDEE